MGALKLLLLLLLLWETWAAVAAGGQLGDRSQRNRRSRRNRRSQLAARISSGDLCEAGHYLSEDCYMDQAKVCCPCPSESFLSHPNREVICQLCTQCREDQEMVSDCTLTHNRQCQCKTGEYYCDSESCPESCLLCTRCPGATLQTCNATRDTVCAPAEPGLSAGSFAIIAIIIIIFVIWCRGQRLLQRVRRFRQRVLQPVGPFSKRLLQGVPHFLKLEDVEPDSQLLVSVQPTTDPERDPLAADVETTQPLQEEAAAGLHPLDAPHLCYLVHEAPSLLAGPSIPGDPVRLGPGPPSAPSTCTALFPHQDALTLGGQEALNLGGQEALFPRQDALTLRGQDALTLRGQDTSIFGDRTRTRAVPTPPVVHGTVSPRVPETQRVPAGCCPGSRGRRSPLPGLAPPPVPPTHASESRPTKLPGFFRLFPLTHTSESRPTKLPGLFRLSLRTHATDHGPGNCQASPGTKRLL